MHQVQVEPLNVDDQLVQVRPISLCLAHDDIQRRAARRAFAGRQAALTRRADGVSTSSVARRFVVANRTLARKGVPTVSAKMVGLRVGDLASSALAHLYLDIWRASLEGYNEKTAFLHLFLSTWLISQEVCWAVEHVQCHGKHEPFAMQYHIEIKRAG